MSHLPNAPTVRGPVCVLCYEPNPTNLILCPECEEWTRQSRIRWGRPVRFKKEQDVPDEPDD